ncbi:hypothetical protein Pmani_038158 [Petrolisthes manimaculis]|uniref:Uncharacterized protein n=1 Tax=Petrolisthes manimaculis TaxID=1843537 RepID=A0AAE1NEY8_9EUCA|nr:hypothetical protein Pmani_038158 [Petrolisthes manimaculis]
MMTKKRKANKERNTCSTELGTNITTGGVRVWQQLERWEEGVGQQWERRVWQQWERWEEGVATMGEFIIQLCSVGVAIAALSHLQPPAPGGTLTLLSIVLFHSYTYIEK